MNLFFRLVWTFLRARFSRPNHPYREHVLDFSVWLTDQDLFQHMNNSRYLAITDLAIIDYLVRTGIWKAARRIGWTPVIVHKDVSIIRMLSFPQRYQVATRFEGWWEGYACLRHEFRSRGRTTAIALSIGRFVGPKTERPRIDQIVETLPWDLEPMPIPAEFQKRIDAIEAARAALRSSASAAPEAEFSK